MSSRSTSMPRSAARDSACLLLIREQEISEISAKVGNREAQLKQCLALFSEATDKVPEGRVPCRVDCGVPVRCMQHSSGCSSCNIARRCNRPSR